MTNETRDVFGWLADRTGCGTIRIMQPLDALSSELGLNTYYSERFGLRGMMPKVIVGQRVVKDEPTHLWKTIQQQSRRPKLVFEVDDDLWNIDPSNERAYQWFATGYDTQTGITHDVRNNVIQNITLADRVTCTTPALAEILSQWNDDVRIVPNYIPRWLTEFERGRRDRLTIGWVGSSTHDMDWATAANEVRRFLNRNPDIDFKIIGAEYGDWLKIPREQVVETGWFDSVEECWKAIDFDIALAPLRPHTFNNSKSYIKALEAAALGIPIIASDVGPYTDFVEHGVTGFLVKRDHEWQTYLRDLANDEGMRDELGRNAHEKAKRFTLEGNIQQWAEALTVW